VYQFFSLNTKTYAIVSSVTFSMTASDFRKGKLFQILLNYYTSRAITTLQIIRQKEISV